MRFYFLLRFSVPRGLCRTTIVLPLGPCHSSKVNMFERADVIKYGLQVVGSGHPSS